ncbi:Hydrogen peroxide-inducible genes activator [Aquimixticola soesokkakensis]|uniref:Hydrogen peroxide-inducible genes activator n=1 Tax=Aquimixticola soesokkakensis TaxID=1519096 RepID=A0A1Y5S3M3_9RHOB|nr:LysR family transcriptional regulator [Aquimixticola soesokkakensis]SLN31982.1 Hydrogen peroxide-inducible genes activator [Aquimixticola soesokkakensis]
MADNGGRITLWGIEVFVAVAEERSITAAARRLGASPSSVSQQISNLETAMGAELMHRRERPIPLTPAGDVLMRRAQIILGEAAQVRAELAELDPTQLSQLRLGMIEDFDASVTPALLSSMAGALKSTQFQLETGPSHRLLDRLDTRLLDVVVAADMGAVPSWMERAPLLDDPFVAVVPKGFVAAGEPLDPQALRRLPLIQYTQRHVMGRVIASHLEAQDVALSHRFELDSYRAILAMVAGGAGWTILSALGVDHAHRFLDRIEVLALPFAPLKRTISLGVRRDGLAETGARIAADLRPLLQELVVAPNVARHPFLAGALRVL